jgi:hypothetical protein
MHCWSVLQKTKSFCWGIWAIVVLVPDPKNDDFLMWVLFWQDGLYSSLDTISDEVGSCHPRSISRRTLTTSANQDSELSADQVAQYRLWVVCARYQILNAFWLLYQSSAASQQHHRGVPELETYEPDQKQSSCTKYIHVESWILF